MNGYSEVWLNPTNDWIYPHLHEIAQRMTELAHRFQEPTVLQERALNQAAREMLLAQSSDWAFMMKTGATVEYARHRTRLHVSNFLDLFEQLSSGNLDESHLHELESRQNIFPQIDFRLFR
jgi:1,4-alpha-glucan branching enzyme